MSTYRDDMLAKARRVDARLYDAMTKCCFTDTCLPQMVKALSMYSWQNTPEENERLEAAKYYLRNKHKLQSKRSA